MRNTKHKIFLKYPIVFDLFRKIINNDKRMYLDTCSNDKAVLTPKAVYKINSDRIRLGLKAGMPENVIPLIIEDESK